MVAAQSEAKCKGIARYDLPNASMNFGSLGDFISENIRGEKEEYIIEQNFTKENAVH